MVGLERSTLPLIGETDFGLASSAAVLSFIVAFGLAKSFTNLAAGVGAERFGRRRLLILGWTVALPVPLLIAVAPSWAWIVAANALLGVNQGLAWSMTVVMKIDLVGPKRRGLALGLNEAAGYGGVAVAAALSGWLASDFAPRDVLVALERRSPSPRWSPWCSSATPPATSAGAAGHDREETAPLSRQVFPDASYRRPALRACSQAGLVNNLNDALAWGLVPLFLAATAPRRPRSGSSPGSTRASGESGRSSPASWSDRIGRKPLIVAGMLVQRRALGAAGGLRRRRRPGRGSRRAAGRRHRARLPHSDRRDLGRRLPLSPARPPLASTASGATWATSPVARAGAAPPTRSGTAARSRSFAALTAVSGCGSPSTCMRQRQPDPVEASTGRPGRISVCPSARRFRSRCGVTAELVGSMSLATDSASGSRWSMCCGRASWAFASPRTSSSASPSARSSTTWRCSRGWVATRTRTSSRRGSATTSSCARIGISRIRSTCASWSATSVAARPPARRVRRLGSLLVSGRGAGDDGVDSLPARGAVRDCVSVWGRRCVMASSTCSSAGMARGAGRDRRQRDRAVGPHRGDRRHRGELPPARWRRRRSTGRAAVREGSSTPRWPGTSVTTRTRCWAGSTRRRGGTPRSGRAHARAMDVRRRVGRRARGDRGLRRPQVALHDRALARCAAERRRPRCGRGWASARPSCGVPA